MRRPHDLSYDARTHASAQGDRGGDEAETPAAQHEKPRGGSLDQGNEVVGDGVRREARAQCQGEEAPEQPATDAVMKAGSGSSAKAEMAAARYGPRYAAGGEQRGRGEATAGDRMTPTTLRARAPGSGGERKRRVRRIRHRDGPHEDGFRRGRSQAASRGLRRVRRRASRP